MKVCIIASHFLPNKTGVSLHLDNLVKNLSKLEHEVLLLAPDYSIAADIFPGFKDYIGEIYPRIRVVSVPSVHFEVKSDLLKYRRHSTWNLDDYIGSFAPDIIQVDEPEHIYGLKLFGLRRTSSYSYEDCIGIDYARKKSIPIIAFFHTYNSYIAETVVPKEVQTDYRLNPKAVYQKTYGPYRKVFCASKDAFEFLTNHGLTNVKYGRYIGINDDFLKIGLTASRSDNNGNINLIYTGRFFAKDEPDALVRIFNMARKKYPGLSLYIAGFERWREALHEIGALEDNRIKYLGSLDQEKLAEAYAASHIFFSPFKIDTLGLSTIEAMAAGLPCIVRDKGGARNIVENGVCGYRCNTEGEFVDAILKVIKHREFLREKNEKSVEKARQYLSSVCAANILQEYERLIEDGGLRNGIQG